VIDLLAGTGMSFGDRGPVPVDASSQLTVYSVTA
jgi:hypothetical protein